MNKDAYGRPARPWDLYNRELGRVESSAAEERLALCKACPKYIPLTHQCLECGCIMNLKVKLPNAECPLGKWGQTTGAVKPDNT